MDEVCFRAPDHTNCQTLYVLFSHRATMQEGSVDEVCFRAPDLGPLAALMVAPEGGRWVCDEVDVSSSRTGHTDRRARPALPRPPRLAYRFTSLLACPPACLPAS